MRELKSRLYRRHQLIAVTNTALATPKSFILREWPIPKFTAVFSSIRQKRPKRNRLFYTTAGAVVATEGYQQIAKYWLDEGYSVLGMDSRLQGAKPLTRTNISSGNTV